MDLSVEGSQRVSMGVCFHFPLNVFLNLVHCYRLYVDLGNSIMYVAPNMNLVITFARADRKSVV